MISSGMANDRDFEANLVGMSTMNYRGKNVPKIPIALGNAQKNRTNRSDFAGQEEHLSADG